MAGRDQLVGRTRAYRLVDADMALARDCMQQDRLGASPNRCTAPASMTGFYSGYVYEVIPASLVLKLRRKPEEWCDEYESGLLRVRAGGLPDAALRPLRKCGHTVSSLQRLRAGYEVEQFRRDFVLAGVPR